MELYIDLTNVRDKKKTVYWAYLDLDTRKMLSEVDFDEDDEIAALQLKRKLVELFGQRQKDTLDLIKEFGQRRQRVGENVRMYCLELQAMCKRAFTDCLNHEKYIMQQFIAGVGNRQLQLNLSSVQPESLNKMMDIATKYEEAFNKQLESRKTDIKIEPTSQQSQDRREQQTNSYTQRQGEHSSYQQQTSTMQQQPFLRGQQIDGKPVCHFCREPGHIKWHCPKRPVDNGSANHQQQTNTSTANSV